MSTESNGVAKPQEHCSQNSGEHGAETEPLDNQSNLRKPDTRKSIEVLMGGTHLVYLQLSKC